MIFLKINEMGAFPSVLITKKQVCELLHMMDASHNAYKFQNIILYIILVGFL